jgi:hypothetical protein
VAQIVNLSIDVVKYGDGIKRSETRIDAIDKALCSDVSIKVCSAEGSQWQSGVSFTGRAFHRNALDELMQHEDYK